jgi:hypothetical protein
MDLLVIDFQEAAFDEKCFIGFVHSDGHYLTEGSWDDTFCLL